MPIYPSNYESESDRSDTWFACLCPQRQLIRTAKKKGLATRSATDTVLTDNCQFDVNNDMYMNVNDLK